MPPRGFVSHASQSQNLRSRHAARRFPSPNAEPVAALTEIRSGMAGAALLAACGDGDGDRVAALLREGAPIDRADAVRATWLFPPPASRGAPRTPCRMTRARAEQDGLTPLHLASSKGDVHVAKLLLKQFARHDVKAQDGRRPLHLSSARGHIELTRLLLERGARIDVQTFVRDPPPLSHPPPCLSRIHIAAVP